MGTQKIYVGSILLRVMHAVALEIQIYILHSNDCTEFLRWLYFLLTFDRYLLSSIFIRCFTHRIMRMKHLSHCISL